MLEKQTVVLIEETGDVSGISREPSPVGIDHLPPAKRIPASPAGLSRHAYTAESAQGRSIPDAQSAERRALMIQNQ